MRSTILGPIINARSGGNEIRSRSCPECYLCKAVGTLLYEDLKDELFGAPGSWNLKRCPNPSCGLVWLDPMPTEVDIVKAYERYYTHDSDHQTRSNAPRIKRVKAGLARLYQFCWRFTSVYGEQQELELMCLDGRSPGRVLEVGCGDGRRLAKLRALGWEIQGQEIDVKAATQARKMFGVPIFLGSLDQAGFRDKEFDAVVMSHVLEHVHNPVRFLEECKRVLKPSGLLVSITPNVEGWGHSRFGACWRGLEPPRHLFLFSRSTLEQTALKCGFRDVRTWTTAAHSLWTVRGSLRIESKETVPQDMWPAIKDGIRQLVLHATAVMAHRRNPDVGEECVLNASK